jgi:hypothetical protein
MCVGGCTTWSLLVQPGLALKSSQVQPGANVAGLGGVTRLVTVAGFQLKGDDVGSPRQLDQRVACFSRAISPDIRVNHRE